MSITLTAGWWLLPLAVTMAAFTWSTITARPSSNPSYADGIVGALVHGLALIASLVAWLFWAISAS